MITTDSSYFVFILGDDSQSPVNIGMAGDLQRHVQNLPGKVEATGGGRKKLVYYEYFKAEEVAIARERQLKENTNDVNQHLVESMNPNWLDLSDTLY